MCFSDGSGLKSRIPQVLIISLSANFTLFAEHHFEKRARLITSKNRCSEYQARMFTFLMPYRQCSKISLGHNRPSRHPSFLATSPGDSPKALLKSGTATAYPTGSCGTKYSWPTASMKRDHSRSYREAHQTTKRWIMGTRSVLKSCVGFGSKEGLSTSRSPFVTGIHLKWSVV
ncbi:predicted protein [Sclerotinia sclerotiorum 1980 UF-70]|uniref:Uncharacterized protein n=1 Tax=Sclerotinia sclerotiorum (strain ATCC 18683 / 1980 / Ss-1) TaxID=665079 RepID=A7ECX7_SCLS1|nr:predicted protein [Sclerotinia sclerotiorum 1980 UF-70]EDO00693.1 predicted protein [Sclerotinia sclerotiorum 1980 UF-70]